MNTSDSEIVASVLQSSGWEQTDELDAAQLVLINTCAIREKAETTVFNRLRNLRHAFAVRDVEAPVVGVLGCMAERLKTKLMEQEQLVQLVAGPDAYRDLPRLVDIVRTRRRDEDEEELLENAVNVQLSADETYADIAPVRAANGSKVSAFATVMRGCNNMCSFCIVPFTRGRERAHADYPDRLRRRLQYYYDLELISKLSPRLE
jgi:tRNA-2-methylthio-N6-dimethylallyladenosine synthase